jgi:predicted amidohydrolase YtcJ
MFHVAGDTMAETLLRLMKKDENVGWPKKRVRFEHGDGVLPDLFGGIKTYGVVIVQNPAHLTTVGLLHQRWQGKMESQGLTLRSFLKAGIPLALGSDGPMNPYLNIMLACIHPYRPEEALTREEAVIAYTKTSAYAEFTEKYKGTLTIGMVADLAVLSQDIFTVPLQQLPGTKSVLTMVNGNISYMAE